MNFILNLLAFVGSMSIGVALFAWWIYSTDQKGRS